jgi:hypothetical protein
VVGSAPSRSVTAGSSEGDATVGEGVCGGGHGEMAWAEAAHGLVLAVAALVLYELAGGLVESGRSC